MKHAPEAALKARLATLAGIPKAWPNQDFDLPPVPGDAAARYAWAYLACEIIRTGTSDTTLNAEAPVVTGRLIATAVTLKGTGEARANEIAEQVAALFPMGERIAVSGFVTQITQPPHIREGMGDGAYWRVPVSIPFQTFTSP
ncbi:phage tail terminator-like protein [Paracoccus kondratievae]|uniref:Uncharacterized protein n=1 Tax=Paracoccus kondratievae TaxID=135740 RepID=A0AAD3NXB4_9RHOB|nr:phage tail terminator-like protein [Paracoccus kondratievae]AZV00275.1 tail terminator protein [Paracoccus phage vB_PkoS_Pkon1]GLK63473.1 hypothetical protein GCM10017635_09430 [Paracoccus kondratievae]